MALSNIVRHIVSGSLRTKLCRLCLSETRADCLALTDIMNTVPGALTLAEILQPVVAALPSHLNEMLSDKVCQECCHQAAAAFRFHRRCRQTAAVLDRCVSQLHKGLDNSSTGKGELYIHVTELTATNEEPVIGRPKIKKDTPNCEMSMKTSKDKDTKVTLELLPLKSKVKQEKVSSDDEGEGRMEGVQIKKEVDEEEASDEDLIIIVDDAGVPAVYRFADETRRGLVALTDREKEYFFCRNPRFRPRLKRRTNQRGVKDRNSSLWKGKLDNMQETFSCKRCDMLFIGCHAAEHAAHCKQPARYRCDHCDKTFKHRRSIVNHLRNNHSRLWRSAGGAVAAANFTCYYCGKGYLCASSFEAHLRRHEAAQGSNSCEVCGAWSETRTLLRRHVYREHPAERPYCCPTCRKTFRTQSTLKSHLRTHGREEASHHCEMCWRNFVNERALKWHQRLHTGERPYACEQCGKAFISLNRRNQHALTSHTPPAKRCPLCPALFHLRSMVNSHIRKVHLKAHKRHSRPPKYAEVGWPTERVPLEQLSLRVQAQLLQHRTEPLHRVKREVGDL